MGGHRSGPADHLHLRVQRRFWRHPIPSPFLMTHVFSVPQPTSATSTSALSIAALRFLGVCKGYRFVGTNSAANDAFFVREDYAQHFVDSSIGEIIALPSRFRESRDEGGRPTYLGGMRRLKAIAGLPVVQVETGETIRLGEFNPIYSSAWL